MKSIDFRTNWIPDLLPIGSLWLETSATALCGPYVTVYVYICKYILMQVASHPSLWRTSRSCSLFSPKSLPEVRDHAIQNGVGLVLTEPTKTCNVPRMDQGWEAGHYIDLIDMDLIFRASRAQAATNQKNSWCLGSSLLLCPWNWELITSNSIASKSVSSLMQVASHPSLWRTSRSCSLFSPKSLPEVRDHAIQNGVGLVLTEPTKTCNVPTLPALAAIFAAAN